MISRIQRTLGFLVIPALLAASACGGTVASDPATQSTAAATRAPVAVSAHAGPVRLIGDALADVPLRPDQRTAIEQLATDAEARSAAKEAAHKDLMIALAAQVEAGAIDRAALEPKIDAITAVAQANRPADRAAFEKLHALLDADQRTELVDALEAKMGDHKGAHAGRARMKEWAQILGLSDDQKSQIKAALKARGGAEHAAHARHADEAGEGGGGHGKKVLEAFRGDTFVMDTVAPVRDAKAVAGKMSDHAIGFVETVLPILTPAQRSIAAQKIRDRANGVGEAPALF